MKKLGLLIFLFFYSSLVLSAVNKDCKAFTVGMSYEDAVKQLSLKEKKIFESTKSPSGVQGEESAYDFPDDTDNSQLRIFVKDGLIVDVLDNTENSNYKFCPHKHIAQIGMTHDQIAKIYYQNGKLISSVWNPNCDKVATVYEWNILGLGSVDINFNCESANELTLYQDDNE
jgi:hypothetical protein